LAAADGVTLSGMVKRIFALIVIMFAVPVIVGGFGDPQPVADFVFSSTAEHNNRDPQQMTYLHDIRLTHALFETLVILDFNDMKTYPGVAESWEISEDGLTYTFHLRDNARWSNGDPVTSHDFIYAWQRAMLPDTAAGYGHFMFFIQGAQDFFRWRTQQLEEYVKSYGSAGSEQAAREYWDEALKKFDQMVALSAPDDYTLTIRLNRRTEYFIDMLAFATYMPVHAESVQASVIFNADTGRLLYDPTYWNDADRLICNGPYVLKDRKYRRYNFLVANDYYWDRASMKNSSVLELIVNNEQSQLLSYEAGDIDYVPGVIPEIAFDLIKQDRDDVHVVPMAGTYFYNFNCLPELKNGEKNHLADWRVRRALAMAIDRDEISRSITRLNEDPAYSFVPPKALSFYQPPVEDGPHFDPQGAKALLKEAGYEGGKGLTGLTIMYNTNGGHENTAQAVKNMWKTHLGVDVTLEGVETKISSERARTQDYTIRRTGWYGDYADPTTWLDIRRSEDENNTTKWKNPEYDKLLDEAADASDPKERLELMRRAESILLKESPMALIYHQVSVELYDPAKVKGLNLNGWSRVRFENISVDRDAE
jgi:oligopeptide transport system substrate-binding protein